MEDKNEEQLGVFSKANKISRSAKTEIYYNYNNKCAFYRFYRDFQEFTERSLGSKYNDITELCKLLGEFKMHNVITTEKRECKKWMMNNAVELFDNYFDSHEETYDKGDLNEKEGWDPKQFKIIGVEDNKLLEWLESKNVFNEAKKLINDIRIDMSNVKVGYKDNKFFNDLKRLITDKSNNKVKKENATERLKKSISDLNQLRQKNSTVFQNK